MVGNIRIYRLSQGSWYGTVKMIFPEPQAREISISWSVPRPECSLYILILLSRSVTIVFIELKKHKIYIFEGIKKS